MSPNLLFQLEITNRKLKDILENKRKNTCTRKLPSTRFAFFKSTRLMPPYSVVDIRKEIYTMEITEQMFYILSHSLIAERTYQRL